MKTSIKIVCVLLCFFTFAFFASCSSKHDEKIQVALLVGNEDTFRIAYRDVVRDLAQKRGVELITYAANDDTAIQTDQLKTLLNQGVRHFVILPVSTDITGQLSRLVASFDACAAFSNVAPTVAALKASRKLFYASSLESSAGNFQAKMLDSYFSQNPGKLEGKTMNVVMFYGAYSHSAQKFRLQGVMDGLKSLGYQVNVLAADSANWSRDNARQMMDIWYDRYGSKIDAVIAQNDDMALGAADALIEKGFSASTLAKELPVVGIDAIDDAVRAVNAGTLLGTVKQDGAMQARTAFELVMHFQNEKATGAFSTSDGITSMTQLTNEPPASDSAVLNQCYAVPFVPITSF